MSTTGAARIESLHLYPVKALRGLPLARAELEPCGIRGDRRWMVTDPDGGFLTQREVAVLARLDAVPAGNGIRLLLDGDHHPVAEPGPDAERRTVTVWNDTVPAAMAGPDTDAWLAARLGRPCRMAFLENARARRVGAGGPEDHVGFADAYPVLAVNLRSLAALNEALAASGHDPVPVDRFRGNLVFDGVPAWSEDRWRRVRIGAVSFRMPAPCLRCVVVTRDQRTGLAPQPGEPLRTLGRLNPYPDGIGFGVNLIPDTGSSIRVGDPVEVLEALT